MTTSNVEALNRLASQLDDYADRHPHLQPFTLLSESSGEGRILNLEAANVWEELLRASPDDDLSLHHMAIIHHGLAFRGYRDLVANHAQTLGHWKQALDCWAKLIRHDAFWDRLQMTWQERAQVPGDVVAQQLVQVPLVEVRRQLPAHLFKVHVTLIQDTWQQSPDIAKDHVALIVQSSFDAALVDRTRRNIYTLLVSDVQTMLSDMEFSKARDQLETYLRIDPDYPQALADRLLVTIKECNRLDGFSAKQRRFTVDECWAKRLQPFTIASGKVRPEVALHSAAMLCDYYYARGMASLGESSNVVKSNRSSAIDLLFDSAQILSLACDYERTGQKAANNYFQACYYSALLASGDDTRAETARKLQQDCRRRFSHSPISYLMESLLLHGKGEVEGSEAALAKAERLNDNCPDPFSLECLSNVKQIVTRRGPNVVQLFEEGVDALNADNFWTAKEKFEAALQSCPDDSENRLMVAIHLALAHVRLGHLQDARRLHTESNRLLKHYPSPNAAKLVFIVGSLL